MSSYLLKIYNHFDRYQLDDINWKKIIEDIPELVPCHSVALRFYNPKNNKLVLISSQGLPDYFKKKFKSVDMPDVGWTVVREGGPLIPKDYRMHPAYHQLSDTMEKLGIKKNLIVGIFIERKFLGFIALNRIENRPFKRTEVNKIKIVANIIAKELTRFYHLGIENALYYFFLRVKKGIGQKKFFNETLEGLVECFNVNGAAVLILNGKLLEPISNIGGIIKSRKRSIIGFPELIQHIDAQNAFLLSKEKSEKLCKKNHQIAAVPISLPDEQQGFLLLCFRKQFLLTNDDLALLYVWATAISNYLCNIHAIKFLQKEKKAIAKLSKSVIEALVNAFEIRSPHFKGHSHEVAKYCMNFGRTLGWSKQRIEKLYTAALLHDIGKIGVPDQILNKPGSLTKREREIMNHHPLISIQIISGIKKLKGIRQIIKHHHEQWDGKGYPDQKKKKKIPLGSRIMKICDTYQALISDRPYRRSYTKRQAVMIIKEESGSDLDPELVKVFLDNLKFITKTKID